MSSIITSAREFELDKIGDFLTKFNSNTVINSFTDYSYLLNQIRSRIYYFQEIFYLNIDVESNSIKALETVILPNEDFNKTCHIGIMCYSSDMKYMVDLNTYIRKELLGRNYSKLSIGIVENVMNTQLVSGMGFVKELSLHHETRDLVDVAIYSNFLN